MSSPSLLLLALPPTLHENFQTKFFGWADDRAKDLLQDSNEYNADRPKANPRQPLSTTNIKSTARSLDNIKQTLGFEL